MALKSFQVEKNFLSPYVEMTNIPHRPQKIKGRQFKRGQIVQGELKHANNQPAFILVEGTFMIPVSHLKEVVAKDINSSAEGSGETKPKAKKIISTNPKIQYMDAAILGAIVGFGGVYLAERQGWITVPEKKYRVYGALAGTLIAIYAVYRIKNSKPKKENTEE